MRAEVVDFEWPDLERGDQDSGDICMTLLVFIARPIGEQGGETFQVTVCTPEGLTVLLARDDAVIGRHYLFVATLDTERVEALIRDRLRRLDCDSWSALASKIGRIGHWEFEDYSGGS